MKLILSGCLLAAAAAALTGCRRDAAVRPAPVETATAQVVASLSQQIPSNLNAVGTLHARESSTLSAQVMGRVVQVLVHAGDRVAAGQTLLVLDDTALRASAAAADASVRAAEEQMAAAQSNADLAASTLARYRQLQAQKSVSPQEMDEVARRAEAARAQVNALQAQSKAAREQAANAHTMLSYTRLRAPFAGVITSRMADPGALAAPGVPLIQIDRDGPLELDATVDESAMAAVRLGMTLPVQVDGAPGADATGKVLEIVPAADPASRSFTIKIALAPSKLLRAGMYGTAQIRMGERQAILAPASAFVARGSLECAYVLDGNGIARLRYVTLGPVHGSLVEVLSGISAGERLVDQPSDRDLAGMRIDAENAGAPSEVQP